MGNFYIFDGMSNPACLHSKRRKDILNSNVLNFVVHIYYNSDRIYAVGEQVNQVLYITTYVA